MGRISAQDTRRTNGLAATINRNGVLAGKVAVVTGASRGIGEAIAIRYAQEGAKVVVSARTVEDGDHFLPGSMNSVVKRIRDAGGEATAIRCDLAKSAEREHLIAETERVYGPVDILVNNAAVSYMQPIEAFTEKQFKLMVEVQMYAPFHLTQLVLPKMRERKSGWILNISSHGAIHPALTGAVGPSQGDASSTTVYGMVKAALERFTTGLAASVYADHIGANVISPGSIATPGVLYHNLVTEENKDEWVPVNNMAEACLFLVHGDPATNSGRITYAADILREYNLAPAELLD